MLSIGVNLLDVLYSYNVCGRYVQSEQMRCKEYAVLSRLHKEDMQKVYVGDEEEMTSLMVDEIVLRTVSCEGRHETGHSNR